MKIKIQYATRKNKEILLLIVKRNKLGKKIIAIFLSLDKILLTCSISTCSMFYTGVTYLSECVSFPIVRQLGYKSDKELPVVLSQSHFVYNFESRLVNYFYLSILCSCNLFKKQGTEGLPLPGCDTSSTWN